MRAAVAEVHPPTANRAEAVAAVVAAVRILHQAEAQVAVQAQLQVEAHQDQQVVVQEDNKTT